MGGAEETREYKGESCSWARGESLPRRTRVCASACGASVKFRGYFRANVAQKEYVIKRATVGD